MISENKRKKLNNDYEIKYKNLNNNYIQDKRKTLNNDYEIKYKNLNNNYEFKRKKLNNYYSQDYVNKHFIISKELCNEINSYLFDEEHAKKEWKKKMSITLSLINKRHYWVPSYYFPNSYKKSNHKIIPCTECYVQAFITNTIDSSNCISCELLQLQDGIPYGKNLLNIRNYTYYDSLCKNSPTIARLLLSSDKLTAEYSLQIISGVIVSNPVKQKMCELIRQKKYKLKS